MRAARSVPWPCHSGESIFWGKERPPIVEVAARQNRRGLRPWPWPGPINVAAPGSRETIDFDQKMTIGRSITWSPTQIQVVPCSTHVAFPTQFRAPQGASPRPFAGATRGKCCAGMRRIRWNWRLGTRAVRCLALRSSLVLIHADSILIPCLFHAYSMFIPCLPTHT